VLLDAEIAHLGDPAFDVGSLLAQGWLPASARGERAAGDALARATWRAYADAYAGEERPAWWEVARYAGIELLRRTLGAARVPAGQLELQDGLSVDEPDHFHAYRELLVTDNLQILDNGVLVDATEVVGQDADGNDILAPISNGPPPLRAFLGARLSSDFFDRFNDPSDLHFNILSQAERRLVAEWLDVGAQYYNNPFDAPAN